MSALLPGIRIARRMVASTCATALLSGLASAQTWYGEAMNNSRTNPDPSIAAGQGYVVETTNSRISVYATGTGTPSLLFHENLGGTALNNTPQSFFGPLGASRIVSTRVVHDRFDNAYGLVGLEINGLPTAVQGIYVAWTGSQPGVMANWRRYVTPQPRFNSAVAGWINNPAQGINNVQYRADYNGLGTNATQLIYSANLQPVSQPTAPNVQFYRIFNKSSLAAGGTLVLNVDYYDVFVWNRQTYEFACAAHDLDHSGTAAIFASVREQPAAPGTGNVVELNQFSNGAAVAPPASISVSNYIYSANWAPQGAMTGYPNPPLDSGDGRVTAAVVCDGRVFLCHTVLIPYAASFLKNVLRWYDINLNGWPTSGAQPTLVQQGDIDLGFDGSGSPVHTLMGGIAVNSGGVVAVAYTRTSATMKPQMAMSSRYPCDPLTSMTHDSLLGGSPLLVSTFPMSGSGSPQRWGEWSSVAIDGFFQDRVWACSEVVDNTQPGPQWGTRLHRRTLPGAQTGTVLNLGPAYPGNGSPTMSVSSIYPRIGSNPTLDINHGTSPVANVGAFLLLGLVPSAGQPSGLGGLYYIDLNQTHTSVFLQMAPTSPTRFTLHLPPNPAFVGLNLYYQALISDPNSPSGVSFTNGVGITIGC